MTHLSTDKLIHLANLVTEDLAFHPEDVTDMQHIGQCEDCFRKLHRFLVVMEAADAFGYFGTGKESSGRKQAANSAIIQITVFPTYAILAQLQAQHAAWAFDEPLSLTATRSSGSGDCVVRKLEDMDDPHTFLAYDPAKKLLVIQLTCPADGPLPRAYLELADGSIREVAFERRETLLYAQISGLEEGEYRIILEK